jgi:hypothetical protein
MEQIRRTVRLVSPVKGLAILEAVNKIAANGFALSVHRMTILEDGKPAFVIGFEALPADNVLWLVIGHGPAADRDLFLETPYPDLFLRTEKNLVYHPSDETFEQRLASSQEAILVFMEAAVRALESILNKEK